ncbi:hypothetical protein L2666_07865 [Lactobacillus mulieris]|uniref:Uncharacterized protein n=1 Tax=Lactobacillus mulieris TaxID=2508708 RepID=A0AAW5WZ45_9LACO|nr:hypothetical protein [Lactobacillus mulieris]MCZ3622855.1 hypothetical protein [Lactobacillus mulieris]MCZ3624535.1 hypothetical protein [Lactobacillus mulieris]MCZ3636860.1 hypothetical protein [Lactobacillus mulieris]MCZ3690784.1 hypothetical protein [Lactobacillus mulieris]MCZ3696758.1 hypothetical protein [Lactobacillus mulieris]
MTEELNKNTDEFEVVVPEANREEMPKAEFKEQPAYLVNFANFYIAKYNQNDLEIMGSFDKKGNILDINTYLLNNINFSRKELVKHVLNVHDYNFKSLLDEVVDKSNIDPESFATFEDWDKWYEAERNQIPGSLS